MFFHPPESIPPDPPGPSTWRVGPNLDAQGQPVLRVWRLEDPVRYLFRYRDGVHLLVSSDGGSVQVWRPPSSTLEDAATYLLGPVMGFILALRGRTCLHASAVRVADGAIGFLGPAGAGKSTLAAALARRGFPVVTDDILVLDAKPDALYAIPSFPLVRLWPPSVRALFGDGDYLPRLSPGWNKRGLDLSTLADRFQATPVPVGAIYALASREDSPRAPRVEPIDPAAGLALLLGNTYQGYLLDEGQKERAFVFFRHLVDRVPLRRLVGHSNPDQIDQSCDLLLNDVNRLQHV